jgi:hypothetical protein
MKAFIASLTLFSVLACNTSSEPSDKKDSPKVALPGDTGSSLIPEHGHDTIDLYFNKWFKDVRVKKIADSTYSVSGKAQLFEAVYSWVVEDGHEELLSGHGMADAGGPAFGNFSFTFNVTKRRPGSKLHLILYESSAKDGSRQHELPIPLD